MTRIREEEEVHHTEQTEKLKKKRAKNKLSSHDKHVTVKFFLPPAFV